jgi:hypothetical protein
VDCVLGPLQSLHYDDFPDESPTSMLGASSQRTGTEVACGTAAAACSVGSEVLTVLVMKSSSEMLTDLQRTIRRYIPEDGSLRLML